MFGIDDSVAVFSGLYDFLTARGARHDGDAYGRVMRKLPPHLMSRVFLSSAVESSLCLMRRLAGGERVTWADLEGIERINPTADFNVPSVYLHSHRDGDAEPFARGIYAGSAAGEARDTIDGTRDLTATLRRVMCQHGSPRFRARQNKLRTDKGWRIVPHYSMYESNDTHAEHCFVMLFYLLQDEMKIILQHQSGQSPPAATDAQAFEEKQERIALMRLFESAAFLLLGVYTGSSKMLSFVEKHHFAPPTCQHKSRNKSPGLEGISGSHASFVVRCATGGPTARVLYSVVQGLPVAEEIYRAVLVSGTSDKTHELAVSNVLIVNISVCTELMGPDLRFRIFRQA